VSIIAFRDNDDDQYWINSCDHQNDKGANICEIRVKKPSARVVDNAIKSMERSALFHCETFDLSECDLGIQKKAKKINE